MNGSGMVTFLSEANQFCEFVNCRTLFAPSESSLYISALLKLYMAALALPEVDCDDEPSTYERVSINLSFGTYDCYWEVDHPFERDDVVCGSLFDDFCDIYNDIYTGLRIYHDHGAVAAMLEWKWSFESHWKYHAADALRALTRIDIG